jgi:tRNA(fMet)-specific endonuclease VapC
VGIVLDSTVIISAERSGENPKQVVEQIAFDLGDTEATLSVVTIIELAHGIARASSAVRRDVRERFLQELLQAITVEPVSVPIAIRAGKLDGELA